MVGEEGDLDENSEDSETRVLMENEEEGLLDDMLYTCRECRGHARCFRVRSTR
jgi:hypothetical protein